MSPLTALGSCYRAQLGTGLVLSPQHGDQEEFGAESLSQPETAEGD